MTLDEVRDRLRLLAEAIPQKPLRQVIAVCLAALDEVDAARALLDTNPGTIQSGRYSDAYDVARAALDAALKGDT